MAEQKYKELLTSVKEIAPFGEIDQYIYVFYLTSLTLEKIHREVFGNTNTNYPFSKKLSGFFRALKYRASQGSVGKESSSVQFDKLTRVLLADEIRKN